MKEKKENPVIVELDKYRQIVKDSKEVQNNVMDIYNKASDGYTQEQLKTDSKAQTEFTDKFFDMLVEQYGSDINAREKTGISKHEFLDMRKNFTREGIYGLDEMAFRNISNYLVRQNYESPRREAALVEAARIDKPDWKGSIEERLTGITGRKLKNIAYLDPQTAKTLYRQALEQEIQKDDIPFYSGIERLAA